MKFEIEKRKDGSLLWIRIGKLFIDFRDWYQFWAEKGSEEGWDGWSEIWFAKYEFDDIIKDDPTCKWRKMNFFTHNYIHNSHLFKKWLNFVMLISIGFLLGKIF